MSFGKSVLLSLQTSVLILIKIGTTFFMMSWRNPSSKPSAIHCRLPIPYYLVIMTTYCSAVSCVLQVLGGLSKWTAFPTFPWVWCSWHFSHHNAVMTTKAISVWPVQVQHQYINLAQSHFWHGLLNDIIKRLCAQLPVKEIWNSWCH
jgi:uncharacterized membrane protein YphA (DoxX/SURF4 family)